jgi:hypothetical protein
MESSTDALLGSRLPLPRGVQKKWVIPGASAVPILAIIFAFSLGPSPHKVLFDFKTQQVPESALTEVLLDADPVALAPLLITEIADRGMPRRRYAIGYLGQIKSSAALPTLEVILADESEAGHFRADALSAIDSIDRPRGERHALTYRESPDELGRTAREILSARAQVVGTLQ